MKTNHTIGLVPADFLLVSFIDRSGKIDPARESAESEKTCSVLTDNVADLVLYKVDTVTPCNTAAHVTMCLIDWPGGYGKITSGCDRGRDP